MLSSTKVKTSYVSPVQTVDLDQFKAEIETLQERNFSHEQSVLESGTPKEVLHRFINLISIAHLELPQDAVTRNAVAHNAKPVRCGNAKINRNNCHQDCRKNRHAPVYCPIPRR